MSGEPSRRQAIFIGILVIALGAAAGVMIHLRPQALRVPAWVAYVAVATFPLAGVALIAGALGGKRLVPWLGVLLTCGLFAPAAWIAFGPGGRSCSFSLGFIGGAASEFGCRAAFGLGALLCLGLVALSVRAAVKGTRPD